LVKKFYRLEEDEDQFDEEEDSDQEVEYDPARGIGVDSSSEESSDEPEEEEEELESAIVEEEVPKGDASHRLAIVNLDWDNIRAVDILAVLQSFIPTTSQEVVKSVTIYPSEFGKERLQKEAVQGPAIFDNPPPRTKTALKETEEDAVDTTLLRKYQLERLRYYYAIIDCSSVAIANQLYKNLDGTELGATANILDLRFVPDDVTFDDTPKDEASSVPDEHEFPEFVTDALQHSKPKLTWEGEDPRRKRLISEAFTHDTENGKWEALLGSSEDDDEEGEDEGRERYRQLLLGGEQLGEPEEIEADIDEPSQDEQSEEEVEVQPKEETTLESYKRKERERKQRRREEKLAARTASTEEPVDLGFNDPFFSAANPASLKRKEKEAKRAVKIAEEQKRAQKADELELLMHDETTASNNHFNINHILKYQKEVKNKKKKKRDAEKEIELQPGFQMDVNDPRFANVYRGGEFAIDPNSSAFKKGLPGMEAVLEESRRRKREAEGTASEGRKKRHK
jgi:hypothetical protein